MPGNIQTTKINHVTTVVKDIPRALKFYSDLLGIKQIQAPMESSKVIWLQLEDGIMVHLVETPDAPAQPRAIHHAFEVEDFESTKDILKENGVEIKEEGIRMNGQAFLFVADPDGNPVEFCTTEGYTLAPPNA